MLYSLALIAVSVLALVSAKTSDDPSRTWEVFGSETHENCRDYLNNTEQPEKLEELLNKNNCPENLMHCKDAFFKPSVNRQLYGTELPTVSEVEITYVVELICYKEPGKATYLNVTTGEVVSSFLTFVLSYDESGIVLGDKVETMKFYSHLGKMAAVDVHFGRFYERYAGLDQKTTGSYDYDASSTPWWFFNTTAEPQ